MRNLLPASLRGRGEIMQLAYVPRDFDATLRFWIERMGVGPFYMMEHMPYQDVVYRGKPISIDCSVALGYWGNIHIELINQHNPEVVSGYTEEHPVRRDGLHHVLVMSDDVDALHRDWLAAGAVELMTGRVPGAGRFIYLDVGDNGPAVELVHLEPQFWTLFGYMQRRAADWDGRDPIRHVPADPAEWQR